MYNYQDAASYLQSSLFFVLIVIMGAFVVINLVLASIMHSFLEVAQNKKLQEEREIEGI